MENTKANLFFEKLYKGTKLNPQNHFKGIRLKNSSEEDNICDCCSDDGCGSDDCCGFN